MKKILVVGSIAIDNVTYTSVPAQPGMTVYGDSFLSNVGGKGANQSCAIHFLGGDVEFYGAVGNDNNGKIVENYLKEQGLKAFLKKSEYSTGVASITIDNKTAENSIIIVPGANLDINIEDVAKIDFEKYGILLTQLENKIGTIEYILKTAKEKGLFVVLNPAPYHEFSRSYFQYIDLFIPNEHELDLFAKEVNGSSLNKAKYLVSKGVKRVIVTLGEKGSLYVDENEYFYISANKVKAVDTTGAGDSFCGALVTALSKGKDIKEAMEFATKASSITATRKGAIASLPKKEEL